MSGALCGCSLWPFGADDTATGGNGGTPPQPLIPLTVSGVEGELADNVAAMVTLARRPCNTPRAYLRQLGERAREEAADAMRAFGYYAPAIEVRVERSGDCPAVAVSVVSGEPVVVRRVAVTLRGDGEADAALAGLLAASPLATGEPLRHAQYEQLKQRLDSIALERGYLDRRLVTHQLRVDPAAHTADVRLVFETGPRYELGELTIEQEPAELDEALILRLLEHEPGRPYDSGIVSAYYNALISSNYFAAVEVRPLLSQPRGRSIPVMVTVKPRPQHRYSAGVGASTDEGIRSKLSYRNRHITASGHRLLGDLRVSLIEQSLSGEYQIPLAHPNDEWFSLQAGIRREDVDSFDTVESRVGLSQTVRRPWGWMETRFANFNHQSFDIGDDSDNAILLIPGVRWNKTTADDPLYPTRGYTLDFELRGSARTPLSDVSFARTLLSAGTVLGIGSRFRILMRADAGYSWTDAFGDLPPSERFFAGGDVSIRGFDFEAIGPEDANGDVVGGRYLGVASVELEQMVTDSWGVAAFVDAGNAFGGEGSDTGVEVGVGLGVRWRSPIGPARVDLAHPLDDNTLLRLHLRIGPDL